MSGQAPGEAYPINLFLPKRVNRFILYFLFVLFPGYEKQGLLLLFLMV